MSRKDSKNRILRKGETQRKDGYYMYRYTDLDGKRKTVYAKNLNNLRQKERKIQRDLDDGIYSNEITLNEMFDDYISLKKGSCKPTTVLLYQSKWDTHIKDSIGYRRLCTIKKSDILRLYSDLHLNGLKVATITLINHVLQPVFELAVEDDLIRKNPCKGCLKRLNFQNDSEERYALTLDEQSRFFNFLKNDKIYSRHYPMFLFAINTGLRVGELTGLTWSDVDLKNNIVSVNHQLIYANPNGKYEFFIYSPKSRSGVRDIPLTKEAHDALVMQKELQFSENRRTNVVIDGYSDFVFSNKNHRTFFPSDINVFLTHAVNAYNNSHDDKLPNIFPHALRHTACTRMAESGMDIKVIQYIMGHSDIKMTMQIYNHVTKERIEKEMQKLQEYNVVNG